MSWVPHITVASIIERENKFLFVEEYIKNNVVLNQPAGHLEENETIEEGCIRETLEETAYLVKVDHLIGIYQERRKGALDMWLRFCFKCTIQKEFTERELDKNIIRKVWLTKLSLIHKIKFGYGPGIGKPGPVDDWISKKLEKTSKRTKTDQEKMNIDIDETGGFGRSFDRDEWA